MHPPFAALGGRPLRVVDGAPRASYSKLRDFDCFFLVVLTFFSFLLFPLLVDSPALGVKALVKFDGWPYLYFPLLLCPLDSLTLGVDASAKFRRLTRRTALAVTGPNDKKLKAKKKRLE